METVRDDSAVDRRTDAHVWADRLRRLWRDEPDGQLRVRPTVAASLVTVAVSWLMTTLAVGLCLLDGVAPEDWTSALVAVIVGLGSALHQSDPRRVRRPEDLPPAPQGADTVGPSWRFGLASIALGIPALAAAHAFWPSAVVFHPSFVVVLSVATVVETAVALRVWHWERHHGRQIVSVLGEPGWLAVRPRPRDDRREAEAAFGR